MVETVILVPAGVETTLSNDNEPRPPTTGGNLVTVRHGCAVHEVNEEDMIYEVFDPAPGREEAQYRDTRPHPPVARFMAYDDLAPAGALGRFSAGMLPPANLQGRWTVVPGGLQGSNIVSLPGGDIELVEVVRTRYRAEGQGRCALCGQTLGQREEEEPPAEHR